MANLEYIAILARLVGFGTLKLIEKRIEMYFIQKLIVLSISKHDWL